MEVWEKCVIYRALGWDISPFAKFPMGLIIPNGLGTLA